MSKREVQVRQGLIGAKELTGNNPPSEMGVPAERKGISLIHGHMKHRFSSENPKNQPCDDDTIASHSGLHHSVSVCLIFGSLY